MKSDQSPIKGGLDPDRWIDDHGDYLFRYAMFRLRNREAAEDAVQESLLAAVQAHNQYQHRSSERTWLVGILRHKIVDHLRRSNRYLAIETDDEADFEAVCFQMEGKFTGHWRAEYAPTQNLRCDEILEQKDFLMTLDRCLRVLPQRMATVFVLKEIDGLSCEEICESLNLSKSNLWVLLHRARLQLRHLLEKEWLAAKPAAASVKASEKVPSRSGELSAVA
ncbi:MAG TPA: sigma-70 family RNA polymerase sigma factor [Pyrinomonadaceae bacterium]|jgi:RNA polymerase sigma-70 factor (ECF subfamily)|nr:sigma-70 family RNA polymerase sigma factor [Pyrinomonadaceae bacterium]